MTQHPVLYMSVCALTEFYAHIYVYIHTFIHTALATSRPKRAE